MTEPKKLTEAEAKQHLREMAIAFVGETVCPLMRGPCAQKCVCFHRGRTSAELQTQEWLIVSPPYCNNAMFVGGNQ